MVFSSTIFLTLFLPIVLSIYAIMSMRWRVLWLVAASLFFYAWGEPKAVLCMILMITCNYALAPYLARSTPPQKSADGWQGLRFSLCQLESRRKLLLIFGVIANLSTLFIYKYLDFSIANINVLLGTAWTLPGIALPIGISFYCFQCLSYLIDVYRGTVKPSDRIDLFALYISFFPALIAGPIVRYIDVYRDLADRRIQLDNWALGLQRFAIGLAKKVMLADPLGLMADKVMSIPTDDIHMVWAWIGILCYALQIFYDFSSYSDMAIGLGRVFNFRFLENFRFPYSADSMQDFWRRWHISLSSWLRDYVYIPLGGSRVSPMRTYVNVWIIFLLCGLWHGASWSFVLWGAWHGLGLTIERAGLNRLLVKLPYIFRNLWVWLFVIIGWVWFRSPDLSYALQYLKVMFIGNNASFWMHLPAYQTISISWALSVVVGLIFSYVGPNQFFSRRKSTWFGLLATLMVFLITWAFAVTSTFSPFIYFRF